MSERAVTTDGLGAWVIKCNPHKTALGPMLDAGEAKRRWCVANNYRSALLAPGQRVLFWVSAHPRRGIWGAGWITGEATADGGRLHVDTHIPLFDDPVTAESLQSVVGLRSMEVFRSPQQANPSWVTAVDLSLLEPLLPRWPDREVSLRT